MPAKSDQRPCRLRRAETKQNEADPFRQSARPSFAHRSSVIRKRQGGPETSARPRSPGSSDGRRRRGGPIRRSRLRTARTRPPSCGMTCPSWTGSGSRGTRAAIGLGRTRRKRPRRASGPSRARCQIACAGGADPGAPLSLRRTGGFYRKIHGFYVDLIDFIAAWPSRSCHPARSGDARTRSRAGRTSRASSPTPAVYYI